MSDKALTFFTFTFCLARFVVDGWQSGIQGGPPTGATCDFLPGDGYNNYGFNLDALADEFVTPVYCWDSCSTCDQSPTTTAASTSANGK